MNAIRPKIVRGNCIRRCKAKTKTGATCRAPVAERGLCFFHAHPEMLSELGQRGGRKNRRYRPDRSEIPQCPIKNVAEVAALVTDTIHQVQGGELDHRDAHAIGYLAGILLKALLEGHMEERLAELEAIVGCKENTNRETFHFVLKESQ